MTRGILAYASYVPRYRLELRLIGQALESPIVGGERTVAAFDEDTTSMGVEAARTALAGRELPHRGSLMFATSRPAYADKTNATAIHAALGLDRSWRCADIEGTRAGGAALALALHGSGPTLVVMADVRTGRPGSTDEVEGGDAAAAFLIGDADDGPVLADVVSTSARSVEVLDRWRLPGAASGTTSETRFSHFAYEDLALDALDQALKDVGETRADVAAVVSSSPHARTRAELARALSVDGTRVASPVDGRVGFAGAADLGLRLVADLDECAPDELVACVSVVDGVDVILLRATSAVADARRQPSVAEQLASGRAGLSYQRFLSWRGILELEPPRRPLPVAPAAPPALRGAGWKFALTASRCAECGMRHLPPNPACARCGAVGRMTPEPMSSARGSVRTFTVDYLALSAGPPVVRAIVDFVGGGRISCEITDVEPDEIAVGDEVEMTFRRLYTAGTTHNYFWKARPARGMRA